MNCSQSKWVCIHRKCGGGNGRWGHDKCDIAFRTTPTCVRRKAIVLFSFNTSIKSINWTVRSDDICIRQHYRTSYTRRLNARNNSFSSMWLWFGRGTRVISHLVCCLTIHMLCVYKLEMFALHSNLYRMHLQWTWNAHACGRLPAYRQFIKIDSAVPTQIRIAWQNQQIKYWRNIGRATYDLYI